MPFPVRLRLAGLALAALAAPALAQTPCEGGFALDPVDGVTQYPCENAALLARLPLADMGVPTNPGTGQPYRGNDIWGWYDDQERRAYAVVGNMSGALFVDVTEPTDPRPLGRLPTATIATTWRAVKVYGDHAFVVADGAGNHGMQVFDLTRLRGLSEDPDRLFTADAVYTGTAGHPIGSVHTLEINTETGFAYLVGSADCAGGLHMVDVRDPAGPAYAGCYAESGYTHETQCVVYRGPDEDYAGREVCIAYQGRTGPGNHIAFVDVTDKDAPTLISTAVYPNPGYTHQGWFDEDQRYLYVNDELDEINGFVPNTRTLRFDVADLDAPEFVDEFFHATQSTDHNLYIRDDIIYESNNTAGLRFLQILAWEPDPPPYTEIGFLDTHPQSNAAGFEGSWSVYPFFPRDDAWGQVSVVSDRTRGLFVIAGPLEHLVSNASEVPAGFGLTLTPNPVTSHARLSLTVAAAQRVRVTLYDTLGRRLATAFDGTLTAGTAHAVDVDTADLAPGRYLVRVEGERFAATRPLVRAK